MEIAKLCDNLKLDDNKKSPIVLVQHTSFEDGAMKLNLYYIGKIHGIR